MKERERGTEIERVREIRQREKKRERARERENTEKERETGTKKERDWVIMRELARGWERGEEGERE